MRPTHHVMISAGVSAVFAAWVKSAPAVAACFLSGIFIDLDHHLDYFIARKEIPLSYKKLVDFCANHHETRMHLVFHSYELIALLWFAIFYFSLNSVWLGIAIGVTAHILCDEVVNPFRPLAYFLSYRIRHKFDRRMLFKKEYFERPSAGV